MEKVSEGSVEDVRSLFKLCQDNVIFKFNRDIHDQDDKSALTIAIVQKNAEMCELLLEHKVSSYELTVTPLLVREVWDSMTGLVKSDTVSPMSRYHCDVSLEVCCP